MALEMDPDVAKKNHQAHNGGLRDHVPDRPRTAVAWVHHDGPVCHRAVLIGPNPMRVLGLIAFALAGYLFWPEYQEAKKLPARLAVRESVQLIDPLKAAACARRRCLRMANSPGSA